MANKFPFSKVISNLVRAKETLPKLLANATKNYFIEENFDKQQFNGEKWKQPLRQINSGTFGKTNTKGKLIKGKHGENKATLVQSGTLRRAVNNSIHSVSWDKIVLKVVDVPYAAVHNEGLRAGRGAGFIMPKRQFIGQDEKLTKLQQELIKSNIDKIWG